MSLHQLPLRDLTHILKPRSIAIVGASADPRSFGGFVLANLVQFGYSGVIHLVSRGSAEINGLPCVSSIDQLPRAIDLAVLAIPEAGVLDAVRALGALNTAAAVLFASGYAEAGEAGVAKQQALQAAASACGLVLIGPNCMGFTNFAEQIPVTFEPLKPYGAPSAKLLGGPGPASGVNASAKISAKVNAKISVVAQSGFMAATLRDAFIGRGLPLATVFSTGNEAGVGLEDVLAHCIADPATGVVAVYAEQIRRPAVFLQLAEQARKKGKPIVMLMPGKSERARAAAQSHTGALAGDHAMAAVQLQRAAVVLVDSLDELFDATAILLVHPQPSGGGTAFVTGSGAMKNLALDFADAITLPLPALSAATTDALVAKLPAYAVAENPLDYTTIGVRQPGLIGELLTLMVADPAIGSLVLCIPAGPAMAQRDKADHILPAVAASAKPALLVITGDDGPMEPFFVDAIRASGVPFFRSADRALRALRQVAAYGQNLARAQRAQRTQGASAAAGAAAPLPAPLRTPLPASGLLAEYQGKAWLKTIGIATPQGALAHSVDEAAAIASRIGYPVVIKAQASDLPHKSEAGGVIVGLQSEAELRSAWTRLYANVAAYKPALRLDGVLVEAMGNKGLELVIGAKRDADWGAVVLVGLGGIWIEALKDVRLLPPDLAEDDVVAELGRLKAAAVLCGTRGAKGVDLQAIAQVVRRVGQQMQANPDILEIDINPLVAYPLGSAVPVLALDALVLARTT